MTTDTAAAGRGYDYQYSSEINGVTTLVGTHETFFNPGSIHVRQATLRLPVFKREPVITATIHSKQSNGPGYVIWQIDYRAEGDHSICKISAQIAQEGHENQFLYLCNFIVVGELGKPQ